MTFVRRGSTWYVATDALDDSRSTFAVARLWQGPAITVVKRPGGLLVVAEATQTSLATNIANIVTADLARDAHVLHIPVQSKVLIDLTTGGQLIKFGNGESAAGVLYPVFAMHDNLRTTIAGWRIKVNPNEISQLHAYPQCCDTSSRTSSCATSTARRRSGSSRASPSMSATPRT